MPALQIRSTAPYDSEGAGRFSIAGPDIKITSGAVIALAMTLNELCTYTTKFGGGQRRHCMED
jgi:two-component sensor histidine kinase